jgi:glycosyltransferase involved in cell wall biosynthesis
MEGELGLADYDLTILMPCLNEAQTLGRCIQKAQDWLRGSGLRGEIVVADNGSTDGSQEIAARLGARVVPVVERGYGSALRGGIDAARGRYVIMGDSDDSYDFGALDAFVAGLDRGYDFVIGNRFAGGIRPGAMPALHRYLGNPVLTFIGRRLFGTACGDFHCGLRGFRRDAALRLDLKSPGMEFASEMIVKALIHGCRITEVPTTLSPDGRGRPPHLRSWRDGWRHLRFYLLLSPRALFLYPGALLFLAGLLLSARLAFGDLRIGSVTFSYHTLIFTCAATVIGWQMVFFWVFAKLVAMRNGLLRQDDMFGWVRRHVPMEAGVILGALLLLGGFGTALYGLLFWYRAGFGPLDELTLVRMVAIASTAMMLGASMLFSSFFLYLLDLALPTVSQAPRRADAPSSIAAHST